MEQSAPCTPDNGPLNTVRDAEMCDSRGAMTPVSGGVGTPSFMNEAPSPLGQLDPHRLRDMVVDKQNPGCQSQMESPYKQQQQQQQYWAPSPAGGPSPSPSNMRSTPANSNSPMTPMMHPSRMSQGSGTPHSMREPQILSPGGMRMQMQQQQMGMCLPGRSPLGSPGSMHLSPSPYITRPPSNASPSAYMQPPQTPVHYPGQMQQLPQASASGVLPPGQVPPASPSGVYSQRMGAMGPPQQQYAYHPQVQPQWNAQPPQTHYVGQPQMMGPSGPPQRVMVQRVPYPASGYPQGMSQPQSSSGQPPPSPVVYPQGGIPPQGQPQRALYAPNTQQMGPTPQAGPAPAAQYPPAYYQQKSQPGYPQPPLYRQQGAQSVPVRAYLGNQPAQMATSPAYSMYPAASGAQQPAVQPQQYSPVAARYPTPVQNASGISPCYPPTAHDMRSPQLMSPTQAPVVPAGVPQAAPPTMVAPVPASAPPMQRSMSNMDMQGNGTTITPQHMRMVPQSAPFYGHEPNIANNVSPDMCLMGCFFVVVEHERVLVDRLDVQEISAVVRLHGGEIEFGPRAYNGANADRITHVICESLRHQLVQQALKERKRCVTLQWLNDVLAKKHLEAPFRVSHLPTFWAENHRPATGKIIAINGFNQNERSGIRMMITAIGARFTPYLTKHNHFLVTKTVEGEKVERSRELGVTVVNYQWLVELYLGIKTAVHDNESGYYPMPGMFPEVNVSPYTLELYSEVCKQLLAAWRAPVMFSTEQWQRASEVKRNVENDESIFPNKKLRMSTPPPSEEQIEERRSQLGSLKDAPIVCFSGFTADEVAALEKKVRFLGGRVTDNVSECTHLVVLNLWRTMKLLEAIALGKNVVGANWITDGYRCRVIPDTLDYFARDEENEKAFGYNLKYSVLRARYRRVFEEVTFYVTPSVEPSYKAICSLITTAGGKLLKDRPQPHLVIQCIETDAPLILVGNESDVHLLQYLTDCGMPVFNVEIVLTGILRQKLENSSLYRVAPVRPPVHQSPAPPATPATRTQNAAQRVAT